MKKFLLCLSTHIEYIQIKTTQVDYLDWSFNFRMSPFTGPAVYDVRFKGERIAYEIAMAELSVFYSGDAPGIVSSQQVFVLVNECLCSI